MPRRLVLVGLALAAVMTAVGCGGKPQPAQPTTPPVAPPVNQAPAAPAIFSDEPIAAGQAMGAAFGGQLELVGVNAPSSVKRGEPFEIEYVWKVTSTPTEDWTMAVHIDHLNPYWRLNKDQKPPVPTTKWPTGKYVHWKQQVVFPAAAKTGDYTLTVYPYRAVPGMKPPLNFENLPATTKGTQGKITVTTG